MQADPGTTFRVEDFFADAGKLDEWSFIERHGLAFLVHHGALADLRPPSKPQPTLAESTIPVGSAPRPVSGFLVFPVRHTGRCPFPNMISVGRTKNNDIVVPDVSVSKFHAFFTEGPNGQLQILDAGSRNGTQVNGAQVPGRNGTPVTVLSRAQVRFGSVEMSYLSAAEFREFVLRYCAG